MALTKRRRAIISVVLLILTGCLYPFGKQVARFEVQRSDIEQLIAAANPEDRKPPQEVHDMLLLSLHGDTVPYSARLLIDRFSDRSASGGAINWQIIYASWCALTALHFSEEGRLALIASLAPTGEGRSGLSESAKAIFHRPLSALSKAEAATLVVLTRRPALADNAARLGSERDQLLSDYEKPHLRQK